MALACPNNQVFREDLLSCGGTCLEPKHDKCENTPHLKGCGCEDGLLRNEKVRNIVLWQLQ